MHTNKDHETTDDSPWRPRTRPAEEDVEQDVPVKTCGWSRRRPTKPQTGRADENLEQDCRWRHANKAREDMHEAADEAAEQDLQRRHVNEAIARSWTRAGDQDHARGLPMKTLDGIAEEDTGQDFPMKTCGWNPRRPSTRTVDEDHARGLPMKTTMNADCRWRRWTGFPMKTSKWSSRRPRTRPALPMKTLNKITDEHTGQYCQWREDGEVCREDIGQDFPYEDMRMKPKKTIWTRTVDGGHAWGVPMKNWTELLMNA